MQQHMSKYLPKGSPHDPGGGGQNINSPLIQILVMLPIKFKRMANAATHKHIF